MRYKYWVGVGASIILGLIFIIAGAGKLTDQAELLTILVETSILPSKLVCLIALWLPWLELILGLCLITGFSVKFVASASSLFVIGFIFHNTWIIEKGFELDTCGCLGILEQEMQVTLSAEAARYMDIGMLVLILIILLCYSGKFFNLRPWFLAKHKITGGFRDNESS